MTAVHRITAAGAPGPLRPTRSQAAVFRLPPVVALYLFTAVVPIWFNLGPLAMSTMRLLLILLVVPLTLRMLAGAYGRLLATDILFLLFTVWTIVALAVNNPDRVVELGGSTAVEFIGGYVIARAYIRTREAFMGLCRAIGVLALGLVGFALAESVTGHPVILEMIARLPALSTFDVVNADKRWGLFRAQTVFAHPIHFGLFCSVAFSLVLVGLKDQIPGTWRWVLTFGVSLGAFLSLSSGAYLAMVLQIGLVLWAVTFARLRQRWWLLFGLFVVLYILIDLLSNRSPIRVFMSYATFSAHTAFWRGLIFDFGMENVWANPLFGLGMNDWVRPDYMRSGSVDNFWLLVAMRYGIPGFALLALGYLLPLVRIGRRDLDADPQLWNLRRAWMFTFMGLTFTLCTVAVWSSIYSFTFFMFGAGMWLMAVEPRGVEGGESQSAPPEPMPRLSRYSRFAPARQRPGAGDQK